MSHASTSNSASGYPEALGVIELNSIIRGYRTLDAMVKRAPIVVRASYPVSSAKFLIFIQGSVAEVEEAMDAGLDAASGRVAGELFLPYCHKQVWAALDEDYGTRPLDAMGLIESASVCDLILAADATVKAVDVEISKMELAQGIGGRAYFVFSGELYDVEEGVEVAASRMRQTSLIERDVICAPHDDMTRELLGMATIHPKY